MDEITSSSLMADEIRVDMELFLGKLQSKIAVIKQFSERAKRLLAEGKNNNLGQVLRIALEMARGANRDIEYEYAEISRKTQVDGKSILNDAEKKKLSAIWHDARNMLTAVIGFTSIAVVKFKAEKFADLEKALNTIQDISFMVDVTINGEVSMKEADFEKYQDFGALVCLALKASQPRRDNVKGEVAVHIDIPANIIIPRGLEMDCSRIFKNLFNNAFDAIVEKGEYPEEDQSIGIFANKVGNILQIEVIDNGIGMTPEVQKMIFEDKFSTKGEKGNGIGLRFCKESVENNFHGNISVESYLGRGTTFYINIPLA